VSSTGESNALVKVLCYYFTVIAFIQKTRAEGFRSLRDSDRRTI